MWFYRVLRIRIDELEMLKLTTLARTPIIVKQIRLLYLLAGGSGNFGHVVQCERLQRALSKDFRRQAQQAVINLSLSVFAARHRIQSSLAPFVDVHLASSCPTPSCWEFERHSWRLGTSAFLQSCCQSMKELLNLRPDRGTASVDLSGLSGSAIARISHLGW